MTLSGAQEQEQERRLCPRLVRRDPQVRLSRTPCGRPAGPDGMCAYHRRRDAAERAARAVLHAEQIRRSVERLRRSSEHEAAS